jgi:hypothetical protein
MITKKRYSKEWRFFLGFVFVCKIKPNTNKAVFLTNNTVDTNQGLLF